MRRRPRSVPVVSRFGSVLDTNACSHPPKSQQAAPKKAAPAAAAPKAAAPAAPVLSETVANVRANAPTGSDDRPVEQIYQKKTQLEHILLRPDTYIGSVEEIAQPLWVFENDKVEKTTRPKGLVFPSSMNDAHPLPLSTLCATSRRWSTARSSSCRVCTRSLTRFS